MTTATIVQEGDMSPPREGGLFQGVKFWFSQKVPSRSRFAAEVKANGGTVVAGEKGADICLVDHLRAPHALGDEKPMYSYQYVEKSVLNGKLEDLASHRVGGEAAQKARKVSAPAAARGRNPFTEEDDRILFKTLARPGVKLGGNAIYQEMESKYGRHSYHGWRSRWYEYYSKLNPDPYHWLEKHGLSAGSDGDDDAPPPPPQRPKKQAKKATQNRKEMDTKKEQAKKISEFTKEDDALLASYCEQIVESSGKDEEYELFEQISEKHPQHKPSAWLRRFNEKILPAINRANVVQRPEEDDNLVATDPSNGSKTPPEQRTKDALPHVNTEASHARRQKSSPLPESDKKAPDNELRYSMPPSSPPQAPDRHTPNMGNKVSQDQPTQPMPQQQRKQSTSSVDTAAPQERQPSPVKRNGGPAKPLKTLTSEVEIKEPSPKKDQISRWRAVVSEQAAPPAAPKPGQKRKREPSCSRAGFMIAPRENRYSRERSGEVPSTPEPEKFTSRPKREPSPELGTDALFRPGRLESSDSDGDTRARKHHKPDVEIKEDVDSELALLDLDLSVPVLPSSPPRSQPASQDTAPQDGYFEPFLKEMNAKYGVSDEQVVWAIERTSAVIDLAEMVCEALGKGEGLPNHDGVWTEAEDDILKGGNSKAMEALEKRKLGGVTKRMSFLQEWDMADD